MVTKAQASMASDTVFSQIRSGCHDRHAPWGRKVDITSISPRKRPARMQPQSDGPPGQRLKSFSFPPPVQAQPQPLRVRPVRGGTCDFVTCELKTNWSIYQQ